MEAGVPATFFLNTERFEDEHEAWWDVVERILVSEVAVPDHLSIKVREQQLEHPTATAEERAAALAALHGRLLYLPAQERDAAIEQLWQWSNLENLPVRRTHRLMTAKEAYHLSLRPGHAIGAHTTHHLFLPAHPLPVQRREIVENKMHLERVIGRPIVALSYPYGGFSPETEEVVRDASFQCAMTVEAGTVEAGMNPMRLPRLEIKSSEAESFEWLLRRSFIA
jgi:peptidoglycan/xylan/chitin deacetylase (PgdA/CDA1 family)